MFTYATETPVFPLDYHKTKVPSSKDRCKATSQPSPAQGAQGTAPNFASERGPQ